MRQGAYGGVRASARGHWFVATGPESDGRIATEAQDEERDESDN